MFASKQKSFSPSRVSIEEANSHLQLVHQKVQHLESIIAIKEQQLIQREDIHRKEIKKLNENSFELNQEIKTLNIRVKDLEKRLSEKNELISDNLEKLSQIRVFAPNLEKLVKVMNSLSVNKEMNGFCVDSERRKLKIGKSFKITSNFSDEESDPLLANQSSSFSSKKVTQI